MRECAEGRVSHLSQENPQSIHKVAMKHSGAMGNININKTPTFGRPEVCILVGHFVSIMFLF
jgi:hypothetical protein